MLDVYKMLRPCDSTKFNGTLNASKPGLGKTFEVLMTAAVIALAHLSQEHYRQHTQEHDARGTGECALNHPFGIRCYCDPDSLTRQIYQTTSRAPQLALVPAGIVDQWIREGYDKFKPRMVFKSGTKVIKVLEEPLLLMGWVQSGSIRHSSKNIKSRYPVNLSHFQPSLEITGKMVSRQKYQPRILRERNKYLRIRVTVESAKDGIPMRGEMTHQGRQITGCCIIKKDIPCSHPQSPYLTRMLECG